MKIKHLGAWTKRRGFRHLAGLGVGLAVLLHQTTPAAAATFIVNTTLDGTDTLPGDGTCITPAGTCSLRAAVLEANALAGFDVIRIPLVGVVKLSFPGVGEDAASVGDLDVTETLKIYGLGYGNTIIDAAKLDRAFHVLGGASLYLSDLTVRNGSVAGQEGGCIYNTAGTLGLFLVTIEKCSADTGGGIYNASGGIESYDIRLQKNTATSDGGGAYSAAGNVEFQNFLIENNRAVGDAGGLYAAGQALVMYSGIVQKNKANGSGGGVYIGTMSVTSSIYNAAFLKNKAGLNGGGIRNHDVLSLNGTILEGNKADSGGGFFNGASGVVTMTGITFSKNSALSFGGGLSNFDEATLRRVTMVDNTAPAGAGAAIYRNGAVSTTLTNTIVKGKGTCDGPVTSGGTNLETLNACGLAMTGDLTNTDPKLSKILSFSFADGGYPLTRFYTPLAGSPAIDAGNNAFASGEQRSASSSVDGNGDGVNVTDIGAIESAASVY